MKLRSATVWQLFMWEVSYGIWGGDGYPGHCSFRDVSHPALPAFLPGLGGASTHPRRIWPRAYQGAPAEGESVYKPVKKHPSFGARCKLASPANSVPLLLRGAAFLLCFDWLTVSRRQLFSSHNAGNFIPASGALGSGMEKRKRQSVRVRRGAL